MVTVSREDADAPRALAIFVPITTQNRKSPYEVEIPKLPFLHEVSVANVQGIASIPTIRLQRKLGILPEMTMIAIRRALAFALNLPTPAAAV